MFRRIPGCFARSLGRLNYSLKPHKHLAHMGLENVEAIAAVEHIDMIAYGHSDLRAAWHYRFV